MSHSFSLTPSNKLHSRNNFILKQCSGRIDFLCGIRKKNKKTWRTEQSNLTLREVHVHSPSNLIAQNDGQKKHHATDVSPEWEPRSLEARTNYNQTLSNK